MTPVLDVPRRTLENKSMLFAARIVQKAAELLAEEASEAREVSRYLLVADRISAVLESSRPSRQRVLKTSPALIESSGRSRTLIEMIEAEPGDEDARLRLAKLLFRALLWQPETFPEPSG